MNRHERSPYLDDSLFKSLDMPTLPVNVFLTLTNTVGLYNRFAALEPDERHQVVDLFNSPRMFNLFSGDEKLRLETSVASIENARKKRFSATA